MPEHDTAQRQRTLGILLGTGPSEPSHQYGIRLAEKAQQTETQVYLYLLDDAVAAITKESIGKLNKQGVKVTACAYAAQRRGIELTDHVTFGGLGLLNDIIQRADRFVGFCS